MRRQNLSDWRTNISLGGQGQPYEASEEVLKLARQAATVVQAEIAGVDIVFTPEGTPVILEVNAVPGWKGLSEVTGTDIAMEVTRYLTKRVGNHQEQQLTDSKDVSN